MNISRQAATNFCLAVAVRAAREKTFGVCRFAPPSEINTLIRMPNFQFE